MTRRDLPSVDALADRLDQEPVPRVVRIAAARAALEEARTRLAAGEPADPEAIARRHLNALLGSRPIRVINATGVLLHTNLGRAPLAAPAAAAAGTVATGYANVELDRATGHRGRRSAYVETLVCGLTGGESAAVTTNAAAALVLAVVALAGTGGVAVSRGELIEIGGSFRLPELLTAAGTRLIEVGTTNRTRPTDYEGTGAAAILKVHPSNYRIEGFTESVETAELAGLAARAGIPLIVDVGSGLLDARVPWLEGPPPSWLADEPGVRQTLAAGADVVIFSGDKLVGGPQAGLAVGVAAAIATLTRHPLARAFRPDGPTLAALGATLELLAGGRAADIPFWEMAARPYEGLLARIEAVQSGVGRGTVIPGTSTPGAGSAPGSGIPSPLLRIDGDAEALWRELLAAPVPILARRDAGAVWIDLRAVDPDDDPAVADALRGG